MPLEHSPRRLNPEIITDLEQDEGESSRAPIMITSGPQVEGNEFQNIRLSTFWSDAPKLWFAQLESEFHLYRIRSDDSKYYAVLRHLGQKCMKVVADILEKPPAKDKYQFLKTTLINRFTDSEEKQLRKLLTGIELGGKKPSELHREMRLLAGGGVADRLLQTLWLQRLPHRVQELLSVVEDAQLEKLAHLADKALDKNDNDGSCIAAVQPDFQNLRVTQTSLNTLTSLLRQASELTIQTQRNMNVMLDAMARSNDRHRPRQRNWNSDFRNRSTSRNKFCFYHKRFGKKAHKCVKSCAWKEVDEQQGN